MGDRVNREKDTIQVMVRMYCRGQHGGARLCADCQALEEYALMRLEKCPFQDGKTTCAKCPVHCYKPAMREKVRQMMRYSGPRMLLRHPLKAVLHILDGRRDVPEKPIRNPITE
jgi:superfamily II helicase